jgi:hypothetical protein
VCALGVQATNLINHDLKGVYNMHTRLLKFACLLATLGAFALTADAQSAVARASVPFEFAAGGAMMPPGEYTVEAPGFSGVIVLHGTVGNSVVLMTFASDALPPSSTAKLLFERRDGMAFLSAVEWPNQSVRLASPFKYAAKVAATAALH